MKISGVLTKSDNAIEAEREGRYPMTQATRRLQRELSGEGIDVTQHQARQLLVKFHSGEWHHTSRCANEVDYYDIEETICEVQAAIAEDPDFLAQFPRSKKPASAPVTKRVIIRWTEFSGWGRRRSSTDHEWEGEAQINGDWIHFDGRRKRLSGNHIWVSIRTAEEVQHDQ